MNRAGARLLQDRDQAQPECSVAGAATPTMGLLVGSGTIGFPDPSAPLYGFLRLVNIADKVAVVKNG
jgi:hypothetical protein